MQKLGDFHFSIPFFNFSSQANPASVLKSAEKIIFEILDFDERHSRCNFSANFAEDQLTDFKTSRVRKGRFKCPDIWGNKFLSLFFHKPVNLHSILHHAKRLNMKKRIGETILIVNEFLKNRPEFNRKCCHAMVLLAAYRIASIRSGDSQKLDEFLSNFPVNCSTSDFKKILFGFMESIEGSLIFSEQLIHTKYNNSIFHPIFSSLVYNFPSPP